MFEFNTRIFLKELNKNLLRNTFAILLICIFFNYLLYHKYKTKDYTVIISLHQSLKFTTKLNFIEKLPLDRLSNQILDFDSEIKDLRDFIVNEINISQYKKVKIDKDHLLFNDKALKLNIDKNFELEDFFIYINSLIRKYEQKKYYSYIKNKSDEASIFSLKLNNYQKNDLNLKIFIMLNIFLIVVFSLFFYWSKNLVFKISILTKKVK